MHTALHKVVIFVINDIQGFVTHINESPFYSLIRTLVLVLVKNQKIKSLAESTIKSHKSQHKSNSETKVSERS